MVSYGISKAATNHLIASTMYVQSCIMDIIKRCCLCCLHIFVPIHSDALPEDAAVLGVLPITIDTPMNRKYMGDADFSSWTKVRAILNP